MKRSKNSLSFAFEKLLNYCVIRLTREGSGDFLRYGSSYTSARFEFYDKFRRKDERLSPLLIRSGDPSFGA